MDGADGGSSLSGSAAQITVDLSRDRAAVVDLTGKVHQLPCCIKHDGPTSVSHYFKPKHTGMEVDGLKVEEAHFRGRKLHGTTVALPEGYSGFILGKKCHGKETSTGGSEYWETNATFQNITVWNHDAMPSKDDAFLRAFHWFSTANALHRTVTPEDLESICFD
ncbi:ribonuclease H2 subunit C domain-containing protein [Striga asiatica]|uniref:Ribonuclease H2 subunit C domain-containing protein n=1 Tax=Striga asiatica TaxID=4170 RepID=A0A5A7Q7Q0_STRAF|nr:ribonuclease H2 subunit C domain-containing protein [Striga asiatica]